MAQTHDGAAKIIAKKAGVSFEKYIELVKQGFKWCYKCKDWHLLELFGKDVTRYDGFTPICFKSRNERKRERYKSTPRERKPMGPAPKAGRDGDKKQARARVNILVQKGKLPHPNSLPCVDCGHVWRAGERRHEYDHKNGYSADAHYTVESVCTKCHHKRDNPKVKQTSCINGHEFSQENTKFKKNGTRLCLVCRRARDKTRRPAVFWRERRKRLKENKDVSKL